MADYEVRGFHAWHHHMAMVMIAQMFLAKERLTHRETAGSCLATIWSRSCVTSCPPTSNPTATSSQCSKAATDEGKQQWIMRIKNRPTCLKHQCVAESDKVELTCPPK